MWAAILRHYDTHHRPRIEREREWFASSKSVEEAITRASLATDQRGKRYDHQRRIPRQSLQAAKAALLKNEASIKTATTFEEVLTIITKAVTDIHRIGNLYMYDAALRIGAYLHLQPERVYLHAGTKTGAQALRIPLNRAFLEPHELPVELRDRPPAEVEDILCIYKDQLRSKP